MMLLKSGLRLTTSDKNLSSLRDKFSYKQLEATKFNNNLIALQLRFDNLSAEKDSAILNLETQKMECLSQKNILGTWQDKYDSALGDTAKSTKECEKLQGELQGLQVEFY